MNRVRCNVGRSSALLLATALLAGCDSAPLGPEDGLTGGVMATFRVSGEDFRVWVTNEETIEQIFALENGESSANIPNGKLIVGSGPGSYNEPWSWHLDPDDIAMAELAIEVCDGRPSLVDELIEDYLLVGNFCPWGAELIDVDDRR